MNGTKQITLPTMTGQETQVPRGHLSCQLLFTLVVSTALWYVMHLLTASGLGSSNVFWEEEVF